MKNRDDLIDPLEWLNPPVPAPANRAISPTLAVILLIVAGFVAGFVVAVVLL
jgi:hypothetical protein